MVYGDDPVKWNEQEADPRDPLGLATYTYMPDMAAIRQSGNLYVYGGSNSVMFVDSSGEIAWFVAPFIGAVVGTIVSGTLRYPERTMGQAPCPIGFWLLFNGAYIEPGSPWENGYAESFNARMRDEFLNGELFGNMYEAEVLAKRWVEYYNTVRPHGSLGGRPPAPEVVIPPPRGLPI